SSQNVTTYLYANVTNIVLSSYGTSATNAVIQTLAGNTWSLSARIFILATGALENARLLLVSNGTQSAGIGNAYDLVGRYFMAHLELDAGIFIPSAGTSMLYFHDYARSKDAECRPKPSWEGETDPILTLSEELRRQQKLLNFIVGLEAFRLQLP